MRPDLTHDPARRSFVDSANAAGTDFPIQNLPYGVFSRGGPRHVGVAIGDAILDLTHLEAARRLPSAALFAGGSLDALMAAGPTTWGEMRHAIAALLDADSPLSPEEREAALVPQDGAHMHLPFTVRGFTDFYASREHATNVGALFRGRDNALMENWLHLPVGYNGRASTVVVSGTPVTRPVGQLKGEGGPVLRPSEKLDMEVELGIVLGMPSAMGTRLTTAEADAMIFGVVLLNDWSARDIQVWEYQPLGPFQGKAFATTISPWVVTADALAPFRTSPPEREKPLLPYLHEMGENAFDITIDAHLGDTRLCRTNARHLYYTPAQMLAHHALSGCAMEAGDLLGTGTISGPDADSLGSLLEITKNGAEPFAGRTFLEDGDTVTLTGFAERDGFRRIGFGACSGTIRPAAPLPPAWRG